jgi:hypothetical protein
LTGIDNHKVIDLPIVTAGAVANTATSGEVILIFNQYAFMHTGNTIHSSMIQLEHFKNVVDERSRRVGGKQRITTHEGHILPLSIQKGLAYMAMRPFTDAEYASLPHVIMTSDVDWDPSVMDLPIESNGSYV